MSDQVKAFQDPNIFIDYKPKSSQTYLLDQHPSLKQKFTFGLPAWAEILIGFGIGTPVQGLKLFFPYVCIRNALQVLVESADFYFFYDGILNLDSFKYTGYTVQSLFSIVVEFPQILSTCIPNAPESSLSTTLSTFSDSIMNLVKTVVYLDHAITMIFNKEWIFVGYYGMYSLLNIVSFIAFLTLNS